jgi:uncharacterized protein (DUF433 family)
MKQLLNRITTSSEICHGKLCIRGMRWPVEVILDMLALGMILSEILSDHPELEKEDILASIRFARIAISGQSLKPAIG